MTDVVSPVVHAETERVHPTAAEWVEWTEADARATWDATLTTLPDYNIYQSYCWGEFKRRQGWVVRRGSVVLDGVMVAMGQCLIREAPAIKVAVVWLPGGPVGTAAGWIRFGEALQRRYQGWRLYLRMHPLAEESSNDIGLLQAAKWHRPRVRLAPRDTFHVCLTSDEPSRYAALSSNWRHNLKRGMQRGHVIEPWGFAQPLEPIYDVVREAARLQRIRRPLSLEDLKMMREMLQEQLVLMVALGDDGKPCAIRAFARIGARAQDVLAGVSAHGRKRYANYPLMWRILERARRQGATWYDLNGADPDGATGVYNFKKGLGGRLVSRMGEWEWAGAKWLRMGMRVVITLRGAR